MQVSQHVQLDFDVEFRLDQSHIKLALTTQTHDITNWVQIGFGFDIDTKFLLLEMMGS